MNFVHLHLEDVVLATELRDRGIDKQMHDQISAKDDAGERMTVIYKGMKPGNFDSAPKASVSGSFKDGKFYAEAVMTQCPSKYDSEKTDYLPSKK